MSSAIAKRIRCCWWLVYACSGCRGCEDPPRPVHERTIARGAPELLPFTFDGGVEAPFVQEPATWFPPAIPAECTRTDPVQRIVVTEAAAFATATEGRSSIVAVMRSSGVLYHWDDHVRALRAPFHDRTNVLVAAGAAQGFAIAWSTASETRLGATVLGVARLSLNARNGEAWVFEEAMRTHVAELTCVQQHCGLVWNATVLRAQREEHPARIGTFLLGIEAPRPSSFLRETEGTARNALASPMGEGTVLRGDRLAWIRSDGEILLPSGVVEFAIDAMGQPWAVRLRSESDAFCLPRGWNIELLRLGVDGAILTTEAIDTVDAKPTGVRLRLLSEGGAIVTWLDTPQCVRSNRVLRWWVRGGASSTAVASAEDYDLASDGLHWSLVLRQNDVLRWIRGTCSTQRDAGARTAP